VRLKAGDGQLNIAHGTETKKIRKN